MHVSFHLTAFGKFGKYLENGKFIWKMMMKKN